MATIEGERISVLVRREGISTSTRRREI